MRSRNPARPRAASSVTTCLAEALAPGVKTAIPPQTLRDVIAPSRMVIGFFDTFMRYVVDRDRDAHKFSIANAAKDYAMSAISPTKRRC